MSIVVSMASPNVPANRHMCALAPVVGFLNKQSFRRRFGFPLWVALPWLGGLLSGSEEAYPPSSWSVACVRVWLPSLARIDKEK